MLDPPAFIDNISVIEDPDDTEWPLKAVFWQGRMPKEELNGVAACRSKDGIHWDLNPGLVLPRYGDRTNAVAAKINGKFVALVRSPRNPYKCRCVWRTESTDLVNWSKPELILKPDLDDEAHFQIYSATAFEYESLYLGFIERMHYQPDKLDSELIFSHDSIHWQRTRRKNTFIPWGLPDTFDSVWLSMPSNGPIPYKRNLWFYYSGRAGAHGAPHPLTYSAIGLAIMRPDGFASLMGGHTDGWFLTPPMEWPEKDLLINAEPRRDVNSYFNFNHGSILIEARDVNNQPIEGYERDAFNPVGNTAGLPMARIHAWWKGNKSLRAMAGKTIRLAFYLRDAHLYSFSAGETPK
jgi:hypothetical protein